MSFRERFYNPDTGAFLSLAAGRFERTAELLAPPSPDAENDRLLPLAVAAEKDGVFLGAQSGLALEGGGDCGKTDSEASCPHMIPVEDFCNSWYEDMVKKVFEVHFCEAWNEVTVK